MRGKWVRKWKEWSEDGLGKRVRHHCKGMQRQENRVHRAHTRVFYFFKCLLIDAVSSLQDMSV